MWLQDDVMAGREELIDPLPEWLHPGAHVSRKSFSGYWVWYTVEEVRHRSMGWYVNVGYTYRPCWLESKSLTSGWPQPNFETWSWQKRAEAQCQLLT